MSGSLFEEWLEKAEEDYLAASALDPNEVAGVVSFHSQQCIEKYLKAALVRQSMPVHRTHNLILLNDLLSEHDRRFARFYDRLTILNLYSIATRYPGIQTTPRDAMQALEVASALRKRIRRLLELEGGS